MKQIEFERVKSNIGEIYRAKVIGGWLVKEINDVMTTCSDRQTDIGYEWRSSLVFIPDAIHQWHIDIEI